MTVVSNPRKRSRQVLIPKPVFALILVASNVLTYRCFLQRTSIPAAEETTAFVANTHNNDNKNNDQYSLARHHSYGFFQDIPNDEWQTHYREPTLASVHYHNQTHPNDQAHLVARWIFFNWDPFFSCPHLKKVGGLGDGPKYTCDPHRLGDTKNNNTNNGCLVYSIGSAGNYLFEDALLRLKPNCEIHVFDPGDYQRNETSSSTTTSASTSSKNVHFHQWGLTSDTYKVEARRGKGEYLTFVEMQRRLGHQDRTIDIFKIDCEGCEWHTYKDWITADIRQILIETHDLGPPADRPTPAAYFDAFLDNGFVLYSKEVNSFWGKGKCAEWSYLKLHPDFFQP